MSPGVRIPRRSRGHPRSRPALSDGFGFAPRACPASPRRGCARRAVDRRTGVGKCAMDEIATSGRRAAGPPVGFSSGGRLTFAEVWCSPAKKWNSGGRAVSRMAVSQEKGLQLLALFRLAGADQIAQRLAHVVRHPHTRHLAVFNHGNLPMETIAGRTGLVADEWVLSAKIQSSFTVEVLTSF